MSDKTKEQMEKDHLSTMKVLGKLEKTVMPLIRKEKFDIPAAIGLYNSIIVTLLRDYIESREDINIENEPIILKAFIASININVPMTFAQIYPIIAPKIHPDSEID